MTKVDSWRVCEADVWSVIGLRQSNLRVEWGKVGARFLVLSVQFVKQVSLNCGVKQDTLTTVSAGVSVSLRRVIIPWDAYNQVLIDVYQYSVVVDLLLQCPKQKTSWKSSPA